MRSAIRGWGERILESWYVPVTWAWLLAMAFAQRIGRTTFDTKFDLTADPGGFLGRSLSLWNPASSFGELQNQAYGYLFPQGSFFWVAELVGLPDWVSQRLWSGLLLIVAFEGCRRLARAMIGGTGVWAPWLAGFAYATAPRLLGSVGVLSGETPPVALLPWAILPIVLAQQGRIGPRTAALLSGVAMLFFGGVNAVGNLATMPLIVFILLGTVRREGGRTLLGWWAGAAALACAWWMLPLLVFGRYSPPFLDYIETSGAVEQPLGWTNVTRGADHWLGFFSMGGEPWWPGAYSLATAPVLVAATAVVAALGMIGLTRRSMPARRAMLCSLILGAVCLTVARPGLLAAPLQGEFQALLDGPLAMLRNVHKVDPLLRLPLALGLAHLVRCASESRGRAGAERGVLRVVVTSGVAVLLLITSVPLWTGQLRQDGWEEIPQAWVDAGHYLDEHADGGTTLLLPGAGFGQQTWGWTIDEPLQGLTDAAWVSRSQVPLAPGPTIRYLDAIQERIADGRGSEALATMLARSGVSHVLVRRDLDLSSSGAPDQGRVDLALSRTPGLTSVAEFGTSSLGDRSLIEIFRVDGAVDRVRAVATDDVKTLSGSSEDVLAAVEGGALEPEAPTVVIGEKNWPAETADLVGDGYRRVDRGFGSLDAVGPVMAKDEEYRYRRAAHDYPAPDPTDAAYADYGPVVASVVASSSAAYSDSVAAAQPDNAPYNAVDGDLATRWAAAPLLDPVGQWLELRFHQQVYFPSLTVQTHFLEGLGAGIRRLRVTAGDTDEVIQVDPETGRAAIPLTGSYDRLRITVEAVDDAVAESSALVGIDELGLAGLTVDRSIVVPATGVDEDSSFVFTARGRRPTCIDTGVGTSCGVLSTARASEEASGIFRRFSLGGNGEWSGTGTVLARPGVPTQRLLEPVFGQVRVRASSTYLDEPSVAPQFAYDGDGRTFWSSQIGDSAPTLRLKWGERRRIRKLSVAPAPGVERPSTATLIAGEERRRIDLSSGTATFEPLETRRMRIRFDVPEDLVGRLGVAELAIPGLDDLRFSIDRDQPTGSVCGLGPELDVNGAVYPTEVSGTLADIIDGTPLDLEVCEPAFPMVSGRVDVGLRATTIFSPTRLVLEPAASADATETASDPVTERALTTEQWGTTHRELTVTAGPDALLVVNENFNDGWSASLDGETLDPVRVDGWKQGFLVPEGEGGDVVLSFGPDRWYKAALALGGLAALLLVLGAVLVGRRERQRMTPVPEHEGPESPAPVWVRLATAVPIGLMGGPALLAGYLLGAFGWRPRFDTALFGAVAVAAAGIAAATVADHAASPPDWCDALAAVGLGMVGAVVLLRRTSPDSGAEERAR